MCLTLNLDSLTSVSKRRKAYKVLRVEYCKTYITPYRYNEVFFGEVLRSDRFSRELSSCELDKRKVIHGIHVFTSLKDARLEVEEFKNLYSQMDPNDVMWVVAEVSVKEEDHVTDGIFEKKKSAVYMKVKIKNIIK